MTRWLIGVAAVAVGGAAQAQVFGAPGSGAGAAGSGAPMGNLTGTFAPNFFNRTQQPLSPYLNLLPGNPAVNYFYGARPGLSPAVSGVGSGPFGFQGAALGPPGAGNRFYLQPPATIDDLPSQPLDAAQQLPVIPTAAHQVIFGNGPRPGGGFRSAAGGRTGFAAQQPAGRGGSPASPRR